MRKKCPLCGSYKHTSKEHYGLAIFLEVIAKICEETTSDELVALSSIIRFMHHATPNQRRRVLRHLLDLYGNRCSSCWAWRV